METKFLLRKIGARILCILFIWLKRIKPYIPAEMLQSIYIWRFDATIFRLLLCTCNKILKDKLQMFQNRLYSYDMQVN